MESPSSENVTAKKFQSKRSMRKETAVDPTGTATSEGDKRVNVIDLVAGQEK